MQTWFYTCKYVFPLSTNAIAKEWEQCLNGLVNINVLLVA